VQKVRRILGGRRRTDPPGRRNASSRPKKQGNDVVVVVFGDGRYHRQTCWIWPSRCARPPPARELDMLLTAGERISNALVAMAIESLGAPGPLVHRIASRGHHHRRPTARPRSSTSPRPGCGRPLDEGRIVAGRRIPRGPARTPGDVTHAGPRGARTPPRWALAAALGRRRLRDLHRRGRDFQRRPADRPQRPPAGTPLPSRRLPRDGRLRRQGVDASLRGNTPAATNIPVHVPLVVLGQTGHRRHRIDQGHTHGRAHSDRASHTTAARPR